MSSCAGTPRLAPVLKLLNKTSQSWSAPQQSALAQVVRGSLYFKPVCSWCGQRTDGPPGWHFCWECDFTRSFRERFGWPADALAATRAYKHNTFWVSALLPDPCRLLPLPEVQPVVKWAKVSEMGPLFLAVGHGDGSGIGGRSWQQMRCGWAVVSVVVEQGRRRLKSAAYGNYPAYVQSVPGAECYALLFFLKNSLPDGNGKLVYVGDNKWVCDSWYLPRQSTTHAQAVHCDIWRQIHATADDIGHDAIEVRWVKAHRKLEDAKDPDDALDIEANNIADEYAKEGAALHPADSSAQDRIKRTDESVYAVARYLGSLIAWYHKQFGSLHVSLEDDQHDACDKSWLLVSGPKYGVPHIAVTAGTGMRTRCCACWASTGESRAFDTRFCPQPEGTGHVMFQLADMVFCQRCGAYSSTSVRKLSRPCTGKVADKWRWSKMMQGMQPVSSKYIGNPVPMEFPGLVSLASDCTGRLNPAELAKRASAAIGSWLFDRTARDAAWRQHVRQFASPDCLFRHV